MTTQRGFTLIELLVALVILTLAVSFAAINLDRGGMQRFSSHAQKSQQWLENARTEAILTSTMWGVVLEENQLQALVWNGPDWRKAADLEALELPENISLSHTLPLLETDERLQPHITILPTGQLLPAGEFLLSNDEEQVTITWKKSFEPQLEYGSDS